MTWCVAVVLGTRPEVIKLFPVIDRLRGARWSRLAVLPSGQHGHLLRQALAEHGLRQLEVPPRPPAMDDPAELVGFLVQRLGASMALLRPDFVLVQGDTTTALAGAMAAADLGVPVGHVEAGLRTYDLSQPHPEESNRQAIGRLAALHFAPTPTAAENLIRERIPAARVAVTGNTIVDNVMRAGYQTAAQQVLHPTAVVTLHRRELAAHLEGVLAGLAGALDNHRDLRMVIPAHPSPAVSEPLRSRLGAHPRVAIVPPLPHARFLGLLRQAAVAITDSGGVQEEAALLGVPLVIARRVTERPEVLASSRAVVTGYEPMAIRGAVDWALCLGKSADRNEMLGDGRAAARIEHCLLQFLAHGGDAVRRP